MRQIVDRPAVKPGNNPLADLKGDLWDIEAEL